MRHIVAPIGTVLRQHARPIGPLIQKENRPVLDNQPSPHASLRAHSPLKNIQRPSAAPTAASEAREDQPKAHRHAARSSIRHPSTHTRAQQQPGATECIATGRVLSATRHASDALRSDICLVSTHARGPRRAHGSRRSGCPGCVRSCTRATISAQVVDIARINISHNKGYATSRTRGLRWGRGSDTAWCTSSMRCEFGENASPPTGLLRAAPPPLPCASQIGVSTAIDGVGDAVPAR